MEATSKHGKTEDVDKTLANRKSTEADKTAGTTTLRPNADPAQLSLDLSFLGALDRGLKPTTTTSSASPERGEPRACKISGTGERDLFTLPTSIIEEIRSQHKPEKAAFGIIGFNASQQLQNTNSTNEKSLASQRPNASIIQPLLGSANPIDMLLNSSTESGSKYVPTPVDDRVNDQVNQIIKSSIKIDKHDRYQPIEVQNNEEKTEMMYETERLLPITD